MFEDPTIRKAMEIAVETEKLGGIFYRKMAKKFADNKEVAQVFTLLAEDEDVHEKQFTKLLERVPEDTGGPMQKENMAYLKIISRTEFFMGRSGIFRDLDAITDKEDALTRAFQLEKDTLSYYQALRDVMGDNSELDAVIAAEKRHVSKVLEYLTTGAEMRGLSDNYKGGPAQQSV